MASPIPTVAAPDSPSKKPVIPSLALPTKGEPVAAAAASSTSSSSAAAPPPPAKKTIDDILKTKSSNALNYDFDSDSEESVEVTITGSKTVDGIYTKTPSSGNVTKAAASSAPPAKPAN